MDNRGIIFLLTGFLSALTFTTGCTDFQLFQCDQQFARTLGITYDRIEQGLVGTDTVDGLNQVCDAYDAFFTCVRRFSDECSRGERLLLEGIEKTNGYLCGEGFEKHVRHSSCINSPSVEPLVESCNARFRREADTFRTLEKEEICDLYKEALDCVEKAVEGECGREAAEHQITIEKELLGPRAEDIDCDLDGNNNLWIIVGAVVGGVVLIVLILIILVCIYQHKRKQKRRREEALPQRMAVMAHPGAGAAAPAYGAPSSAPPAYDYQDPALWQDTKPPIDDNPYTDVQAPPRESHVYAVPTNLHGYDNNTYDAGPVPRKQ